MSGDVREGSIATREWQMKCDVLLVHENQSLFSTFIFSFVFGCFLFFRLPLD